MVLFSFGAVSFTTVVDLVSHRDEDGLTSIFDVLVQEARRSKKGTINKSFFIKK
jgi:Ca2+-binding EF-hand superfamily protein